MRLDVDMERITGGAMAQQVKMGRMDADAGWLGYVLKDLKLTRKVF